MFAKLAQYRKAIAAGITGGCIVLERANGDGVLSAAEWRSAAIAALIAFAVAYSVPNEPATP